MKKDYVPIQDGQEALDEIDLVKQQWTLIWEQLQRDPVTLEKAVARREEYLIMQPFLQKLPAGCSVFDGGCGRGEWAVFLTNWGFNVIGIDISDRTIARFLLV